MILEESKMATEQDNCEVKCHQEEPLAVAENVIPLMNVEAECFVAE